MPAFPHDIFTEPEVDPDTLANLGPLRRLAGEWQGPKGVDVNPKADGPERRQFIEHMLFEPIDGQTNGPQLYLWPPLPHPHQHARGRHHLPRPGRPLAVGAGDRAGAPDLVDPARPGRDRGGHAAEGDDRLVLTAERGSTEYGICSTAFLEHTFRTDRYQINVTFNADGTWSNVQETTLVVRGQGPFIHRDQNRLTKTKDPLPNPWARIIAARAGKTA